MSRAPVAPTLPGTRHPITRRHVLGALLAATLLARHAPDTSLAGGKSGSTSLISGETFVGRTVNPGVFAAVVLGPQHVTAFVSDGLHRALDCWFYGKRIADTVELTATDGARLMGLRSSSGMSGQVVLPDGRTLRFAAPPATGIAGLYAVSVLADGRIHGASSTGAILDGEAIHTRSTWDALPPADASADWQFLGLSSQQTFAAGVTFAAQITLSDGHTVPVGVWMPSDVTGAVWVILLADGEARGQDIALTSAAWIDAQAGPIR